MANKNKKKLTAKQKSQRVKEAQEREQREQERQERSARRRRIFTIVVCAILVLALGIPAVALTVLSS